MKKFVITILIILVALVVYLIVKSDKMASDLEPQPVPNTGGTAGLGMIIENGVVVETQFPGDTIYVAIVSLDEGGFVVIKKDESGNPGAIIGVSEFLTAEPHERFDIGTTEALLDGVKYYASTWHDDGNGVFDPKADSEIVTTEFMVDKNADNPRNSQVIY
jgi:hypothetical protein